jgi:hypothetical protein
MWLALIAVALFVWSRRGAAGGVPYPEANAPIEEQTPESYTPLNDALTNQVAFDIQSGEARFLTTSTSAVGVGVASISLAASHTATGTLLFAASTWTIVGGIIAGAFAVVTALRTYGHLYANSIVEHYENPFGDYFIQAIQAVDRGWQDGSMSSLDVKQLYNALYVAWNNYRAAMFELIGRGKEWEIVAKQSLNNLNNEFQGERLSNGKVLGQGMGGAYPEGFVTSWLNWLAGRISYLEGQGR